MGAGRVRYLVDWAETGRVWLTVVGMIGVAATIASVLIEDLPQSRTRTIAVLSIAAGLGLACSAWLNRIPVSEDWIVPDSQGRLVLRITEGDLFSPGTEDGATVITMNRRYGLTSSDVEVGSLITQLADKVGGPDVLARALPGGFDRDTDLPVGAVDSVIIGGREYLLVAATTVPPEGRFRTTLPLLDVIASLVSIWDFMRQSGRGLRMPILGSGWSGSSLGHELLLSVIAVSLVADHHEHPQPPRVTVVEVVVRRQARDARSLKRVRGVLRDIGYKRAASQAG